LNTVTVSIIIVSFNTKDLLRACLQSVLVSEDWLIAEHALRHRQGSLSAELIVIDNASADGSAAMVRDEFPWVQLIINQNNSGFARANNQGIAAAHGEFVLLLNSDTATIAGAIGSMVKFARQMERVGVVGAQLLNTDRSLQPSGRDFPRFGNLWRDLLPIPSSLRRATRSSTERRDYAATSEVDEVPGAVMLIRRKALEGDGGLNEEYFFFGEDVDLCWSMRKRGWSVFYLPAAQVVHHGGGSHSRVGSERISLMAQRSLYLLFKRHRPGWQAISLKCMLVPVTLLKMAKFSLLSLARCRHGSSGASLRLFVDELAWLSRH
jgi:GT2 family glycosyltransferase